MSNEEDARMLDAARGEAGRMLASTVETPDDGQVKMSVAQFRILANLLGSVAEIAERKDPDEFDAPIDGVRFWVPLPYLKIERRRHEVDLALARDHLC